MDLSVNKAYRPVWESVALHGVFLLLAGMAWWLYRERLFADASYYLFHTLDKGYFRIDHQRLVLAFSQVIPLVGLYLGAGMKSLLVLHSLGHVVFYYAVFLICEHVLRDRAAALGVVVVQVVGTLHLYYSPMLEVCYGAALAFLFHALLQRSSLRRWPELIGLGVLALLLMTSHPENFALFLLVLGYDALERKDHPLKAYVWFAFLFAGLIVFKFLTFSSYESGKVQHAFAMEEHQLYLNLFHPAYWWKIGQMLFFYFGEVLTAFFLGVGVLFYREKARKGFLFVAVFLATIVVINATTMADHFTRYYESMYFPLVTIGFFPFLREVYVKVRGRRRVWLGSVFFLVVLFRLLWIIDNGSVYRDRVVQLERLIERTRSLPGNKFEVEPANAERPFSKLGWSVPLESLLLSTASGSSPVSLCTSVDLDHADNRETLEADEVVVRRWNIQPAEHLRRSLFSVPSGPYRKLNTTGPARVFPDSLIVQRPWKGPYKGGSPKLAPVRLVIPEGYLPLPSVPVEQHHLVARWIGQQDTLPAGTTPLETDVVTRVHDQELEVTMPRTPGAYKLQPGLVLNGKYRYYSPDASPIEIH